PVTVTTPTTNSVTMSWYSVPGAFSYRVYRGTSAGGENRYFTAYGTGTFDRGDPADEVVASPPTTGSMFDNAVKSDGTGWYSAKRITAYQDWSTTFGVSQTTINQTAAIDAEVWARGAGTLFEGRVGARIRVSDQYSVVTKKTVSGAA